MGGEHLFDRIVAAIDNDPGRAAHVVGMAGDLARRMDATVMVVHVREYERAATMSGTPRPGAMPPPLYRETEDEARALVDGAVARLREDGVEAEGRVEPGSAEGSTSRELVEIATRWDAKLIVVGDRGSRVSDVILGGTAHRIVQQAACSVLLVR